MTIDNKRAIKPKENVKQDSPVSHVTWAYSFKISLVSHPGLGLEKQEKRVGGGGGTGEGRLQP
jgi:5-formyltetrahydrofolate cyclo-ligase